MNKVGQAITTLVIGLFAIALVGMVAMSATRPAQPVDRTFAEAVETIDDANLNATALAVADVYGQPWVQFLNLCPGTTPDDIRNGLQVNPENLGITETVPQGTNYIVAMNTDQQFYAEKISMDKVDICTTVGQLPMSNAASMLPLAKTPEGQWVFAG